MTADSHEKVNAGHLKRNAYLYIRQSTLRGLAPAPGNLCTHRHPHPR